MSATNTRSSDDRERVRYDGFDGAYIVECARDRRIETWGDDHPVLAIRGLGRDKNGGCSLRFDSRDAAWQDLCKAVAGKERVETRMLGFFRDNNEVERHADMLVVVGRSATTARILVSMLPLAEPDCIMQVRLTRETAERLAKAMTTVDHRARKRLVLEALRNDLEVTHEHSR